MTSKRRFKRERLFGSRSVPSEKRVPVEEIGKPSTRSRARPFGAVRVFFLGKREGKKFIPVFF